MEKTEPDPTSSEIVYLPTTGSEEELIEATFVAALQDPSPRGKQLLQLTRARLGLSLHERAQPAAIAIINRVCQRFPNLKEGSLEAVERWARQFHGSVSNRARMVVRQMEMVGIAPIVIASSNVTLGVILLKANSA